MVYRSLGHGRFMRIDDCLYDPMDNLIKIGLTS